jgi:hypothetical protein
VFNEVCEGHLLADRQFQGHARAGETVGLHHGQRDTAMGEPRASGGTQAERRLEENPTFLWYSNVNEYTPSVSLKMR